MSRRRQGRSVRRRLRSLRRRFGLRPADSRVTRSNVVQAGVTILVAFAVAAGTLLAAAAAGAWQDSLRQEIKRSAALVEDVRAVYLDEAPIALELALSRARAAALTREAGVTEKKATFAIEQAFQDDHLVRSQYRTDESYNIFARLADLRDRHPDLVALDPARSLQHGDRLRSWALLCLLVTVPLVIGYLIADLVLRRRTTLPASPARNAGDDVDLVPRPWSSGDIKRFGAFVFLGAWVLVTLLPTLQLHYGAQEQRAQALAARKAAEVSSLLQGSGIRRASDTPARSGRAGSTSMPTPRRSPQRPPMPTVDRQSPSRCSGATPRSRPRCARR